MVFTCLKEQIWKKLQGYKEKFLSKLGKKILIKVVAQAIPKYAMSIFCLLNNLLEEINSVLAEFGWGA